MPIIKLLTSKSHLLNGDRIPWTDILSLEKLYQRPEKILPKLKQCDFLFLRIFQRTVDFQETGRLEIYLGYIPNHHPE